MSAHQVVIGALNPNENCYSIGSVDGLNFIACAVGSDVVILASDFQRIQVVPGSAYKREEIVSSINCCADSGKVSVCYGSTIRILEPALSDGKSGNIFSYRWVESQSIELDAIVDSVQWVLDGLRLLVLADCDLLLYQHKMLSTAVNDKPSPSGVKFVLSDEDSAWEIVWRTKLSSKVKYVKFSPDGSLFATCGENDRFVKIWYQERGTYAFSFIYIQHPAPVCGFEWRQTGRYMPRKFVQNTIITWCEDSTARIWKEIPNKDSNQAESLIEAAAIVTHEKQRRKKFTHRHFHLKKTKSRLVTKLTNLMNDKKSPTRTLAGSVLMPSGMIRSSTLADFAVPATTNTVVFCLIASINAENDCFLVPSMNPLSRSNRPFTVHWLNNKELVFTAGAERILAEALLSESADKGDSTSTRASHNGDHSRGISPIGGTMISSSAPSMDLADVPGDIAVPTTPTPSPTHDDTPQRDITAAKDILDVKLELLLRQWSKSYDVLFSIHPVDGSLLTWTLEWIDDSWHQASASFASRFPDAFPLTDASSLNLSMHTFNPHDPVYSELIRRQTFADAENHQITAGNRDRFGTSLLSTILLLTSHENGSLNLWRMTMDENRLSTIVNIVHESRMCGHRFHISQVVPHPTLPLLVTASQFSPAKETVRSAKEAELILWKVSPVGPLCKSGGVRELARVTSHSENAFACISWVPAILPSSVLGTVCNSPSSLFVASNNGHLCVYQAIVDARSLLSHLRVKRGQSRQSSYGSMATGDLHNGRELSKGPLSETFHVVSTQSTAKPGCVLYVDDIDNSDHSPNEILLLHIFDEELVVSNAATKASAGAKESSRAEDDSESSPPQITFHGKYLVVMVVRSEGMDRLRMWSINVNAEQSLLVTDEEHSDTDANKNAKDNSQFYPAAVPIPASSAKLMIQSEKVYDQPIDFGSDIQVTSCVVSAGHLPSASLYPACRAPYTLLLVCSDDQIRFLRCVIDPSNSKMYKWEKWKMINEDIDSSLEMDGEVYSVSSAYSGRFAVAYRSVGAGTMQATSIGKNLELAVYECESSGGVEWLREDTFNLEKCFVPPLSFAMKTNGESIVNILGDLVNLDTLREWVRIDWVSTEDGSHILTVGIGHLISLFTQVSQNTAQQNIVMMKEHETGKRAPLRKSSSLAGNTYGSSRLVKWMCIRTLELQSADGLPPLPTAMSWVRDGLLIVGMNSEMRVYNQWNLSTKLHQTMFESTQPHQLHHHKAHSFKDSAAADERKDSNAANSLAPSVLNISRSHSMLDQLSRKQVDHVTSTKMIKEIMNRVLSASKLQDLNVQEGVLEAISEEGLFEASRLSSPMLPQYHPKQLIEMLNAGKTKRVKAVLLHVLRVLKHRQVSVPNPLSRAASIRKMTMAGGSASREQPIDVSMQRRSSVAMAPMDEIEPDPYDELDTIAPLPLYSLFAADNASTVYQRTEDLDQNNTQTYDNLFNGQESDDDLDDMLDDIVQNKDRSGGKTNKSRTRHSSGSSELIPQSIQQSGVPTSFTSRHSRVLTELLTHTHLPGLSSVDQMHLLAIADTISHFSSSGVMEKLTHANAALQSVTQTSTLGDSSAAGYASASMGIETVDESGLRFLMAMKQHEYLLLCLPLKQRQLLKAKGISTAHIIWAFHSDTEMELLNAIPCCQKNTENWEELRCYGVAWWLKNTTTLRICVEKIAKTAFQQKQDPMDASLFYLAMRKKNVLTHLFKTVNESKMHDFFREDFTQDKWKKAALKNAFALQSKQRFQHAAAFFLLGGSLKDAIQTILSRLNDLQLALVVLRLYETDAEKQTELITDLLCREIFGCDVSAVKKRKLQGQDSFDSTEMPTFPHASRDPFERSMAFWLIKDYAQAAATLVEEASKDHLISITASEHSLSDIFNFYSFIRKHPLVVRQRLTDAGVNFKGTDEFLAFAKELEGQITPSERRLYFRTAAAHMASGCPLLALDVLSRLPKEITSSLPILPNSQSNFLMKNETPQPTFTVQAPKEENVDWSAPTKVVSNDDFELKWSDEEDDDGEKVEITEGNQVKPDSQVTAQSQQKIAPKQSSLPAVIDFISQHLRFIAVLRIMMDELSTLASGFEIDGGQLRFALFKWLESECEILHDICDFRDDSGTLNDPSFVNDLEKLDIETDVENSDVRELPLHESLRLDRVDMKQKIRNTIRRRNWLNAHQKLIRTLTSYCSLHSAQNYRLTSIQMELLLLLLEVQRDAGQIRYVNGRILYVVDHLTQTSPRQDGLIFKMDLSNIIQYITKHMFPSEPLPDIHSFPLLVSSISSCRMFVLSPLHFVQNQCLDILLSVAELKEPPAMDTSLAKVYMLYNLCQGLSSCVYQSLSDIDHFCSSASSGSAGVLTYRVRLHSAMYEEIFVKSSPSKWPGVESLTALLAREKDDDSPNLRLLLAEFFVAVTMSLFCYAFTIYDSKWLYRLCAHEINEQAYATIFGGGGEKKLRSSVPVRPPPPMRGPATAQNEESIGQVDDSAAIRAKLHAKVFCKENVKGWGKSQQVSQAAGASEQIISCWVPPRKHIVQFYAEKVEPQPQSGASDLDFDSDEESMSGESNNEENDEEAEGAEYRPHDRPNSYAWLLLRLGAVLHIQHRLHNFLTLAGFDQIDIPTISLHIDNILKVLYSWICYLENQLDTFPNGCPDNFLRSSHIEPVSSGVQSAPLLRKYRSLVEPGNTPFEYEAKGVGPVKRLWEYLVKQEHLSPHFIKYIFAKSGAAMDGKDQGSLSLSTATANSAVVSESVKIIQREHEPIIAFACNAIRPGCIVVSTGREVQEMSLERVLEEQRSAKHSTASFLNNRVELDVAIQNLQRDTLRDNDDYQLITDGSKGRVQGSSYITSFIVDRSRVALQKLRKRPFSGIRRLESHSSLPYYVTGSSDGSIYLWEWGVDQPLFTARTAGQYAKVSKLSFARNGNKFAAVDGDGLLCIWQASQSMPSRKPFFSHKCHTKAATDVKFLGQTSSILLTAGHSTGDQNIVLWDTLMPQSKCMIHSFVGHQDGATCAIYLANTQTILSGGRHGEICMWDVRQRQLRSVLKAFETASVKCLAVDPNCDVLASGSSEGDIKVWTTDVSPQLLHNLPGEHTSRGAGFSLRQLPSSSLQGVQQIFIDDQLRLFSCGADSSLKFRTLPPLFS